MRVREVQKGSAPSSRTMFIGMTEVQTLKCTGMLDTDKLVLTRWAFDGRYVCHRVHRQPSKHRAAIPLRTVTAIDLTVRMVITAIVNQRVRRCVHWRRHSVQQGRRPPNARGRSRAPRWRPLSSKPRAWKQLLTRTTTGVHNFQFTPTMKGITRRKSPLTGSPSSQTYPRVWRHCQRHQCSALDAHGTVCCGGGRDERFTCRLRTASSMTKMAACRRTARFLVSLATINGADARSGQTGSATITGVVTQQAPNTRSLRRALHPKVAGSYELSVRLRRAGGLLATYYKSDDLQQADAVLSDRQHCPIATERASGTAMTACDSSAIVPNIDFDWKFDSPLANRNIVKLEDAAVSPTKGAVRFPSDRFSIRFEGWLRAPVSETFTFYADADDGVSVEIDGKVIIDKFQGMGSSAVTGTAVLTQGAFVSIVVKYREAFGPHCRLKWSSTSTPFRRCRAVHFTTRAMSTTVQCLSSFIRALLIQPRRTPRVLAFTNAVALHMSSFTIHARDTSGNRRYNSGNDDWVVRLTGTSGWAAQGRTNDYTSTKKAPHVYTPSVLCPNCATKLDGNTLTLDKDIVHQLPKGTRFTVSYQKGAIAGTERGLRDWRNAPVGDCVFESQGTTYFTGGKATVTVSVVQGQCTNFGPLTGNKRAVRSIVKSDWTYLGTATVEHGKRHLILDGDLDSSHHREGW